MAKGKSKSGVKIVKSGRKSAGGMDKTGKAGRKEIEGQGFALRRMLVTSGSSFTRQRAAVFDYLSQVNHHPTADEVFMAVKRDVPKISLATVYKNLEALVACGAASKLTYGDSAARYEIRTDHHYHSRCLKCGRITDIAPAEGI